MRNDISFFGTKCLSFQNGLIGLWTGSSVDRALDSKSNSSRFRTRAGNLYLVMESNFISSAYAEGAEMLKNRDPESLYWDLCKVKKKEKNNKTNTLPFTQPWATESNVLCNVGTITTVAMIITLLV